MNKFFTVINKLKPANTKILLVFCVAAFIISFIFLINIEDLSKENITEDYTDKILPIAPMNSYTTQITHAKPEEEIWGISKQVNDNIWTINVAQGDKMATPTEIYEALNLYRGVKGTSALSLDEGLAKLAQSRADTFLSIGRLDKHAGFNAYTQDSNNITSLGFTALGENSSIGYRLEGVHLIEWIFAGDPPHEQNQIDNSWTHVGIGVSGTAVDIIFGKK